MLANWAWYQNERELMVPCSLSRELWHNWAPSIFPHMVSCTARLSPHLAGGSLPSAHHAFSSTVCQIESSIWDVHLCQQQRQTPLLLNYWGATSSSVSLAEMLTTLLEDAQILPLNFLFMIVVHCWLSIMSGWTHIVSPRGVKIGTRPFSFWLWELVLITLGSPFGIGTTLIGAGQRFWPNWGGDVAVMLAVTFFCSGWSLSTSASIRA